MAKILNKLKRRLSTAGDTMSVRSIREDEDNALVPIPDEIYNWKLSLIAVTASAAAIIIGYDAGFIGATVTLKSFKDEFASNLTPSQIADVDSNVVSVFQAGAFFGALLLYPVSEIMGRKLVLIISGFFLTFGAAISLIANHDRGLGAIYAGRVITGLGIGGCSGISPIYVSEIAPAKVRGRLAGTWEVSWQIGGIVGYWINYGVLKHIPSIPKQWMIPFAIQLVPSGIFWIGTFLIPESPRFHVNRGKIDTARKNLAYIRNLSETHPYSIHEMDTIIKDVEERKKLTGEGFFGPIKKLFTSRILLKRLVLSTSLFPMQNSSGINAITYYSVKIFQALGVTGSDATLQSTGIFGILKGFASVVWIFFIVDRFGRRTALLWGSIPCSLCMWYIGGYIKVADPAKRAAAGIVKSDAGGKAAQAMLYLWTIFYGASWNGTPWVINAEIFPQDVRTLTQAINSSSNWFWAFVMGRWSGQAVAAMGYGFFFLFASCMLVCPIIVFLFYPETKGVPLEAMDHLFEVPAWRARDYAMEKFDLEYERGDFLQKEYVEHVESDLNNGVSKDSVAFT